jgi:hypothetical protein
MMAVIETGTWKRTSTNNIVLRGFRDKNDGSYPVNATVTMNLTDSSGAPVAGAQGIAMGYVAGTTGPQTAYRGSVVHSVALAAGLYSAEVIATVAAGQRRFVKPIQVED